MSQDRNDTQRRQGADDDFATWLAEHPQANDDLADLQRLRGLCQSVPLPEPSDAAWMAVRSRISDAVPALHPQRQASPRPMRAILSIAAAAAILGGVLLVRSGRLSGPLPQTQPREEEPYPVAEADDVIIISMDARDVAALVVGEPPIAGELVFAQPTDVRVIKCERCPHSGNVPRLAQGEVPMFVTSVARAEDPDHE